MVLFLSILGRSFLELLGRSDRLDRRTTCKTRENSNFLKNGKIVISVKIQNFSRSRMTKRTSPSE